MRIRAKKPTGAPTEEDFIRAATAVYNSEENSSNMYTYFQDGDLDVGTKFEFVGTHLFLRTIR